MNIRTTEDKSTRLILVAVMAFYILTTVLAISFLKLSGNMDAVADTNLDSSEDVLQEVNENIEVFADRMKEENSAMTWDENDTSEKAKIASQDIVIDEPEEVMPLPEPEPEPEPTPTPAPAPAKEYYSFVSTNVETGLNMREKPDIGSKSIFKLEPGTKGLVLELGDQWSLVAAEGHKGYCDNEYLSMRQISKEEYLEQIDSSDVDFDEEKTEDSGEAPEAGESPESGD